ncbi:MAG TPA: septum site-determining protein MinC [Morganella sp. (in: Bacteria)]|nr:septum site-determining protein MinC [Morganella sp. (in: enterobacteria)]
MSSSPIELKGSNFTLSVLHLNNEDPQIIEQAVREKVGQAPAFFKNAPVVLNVSQISSGANLKIICRAVVEAGLSVVGISGCQDEKMRKAAIRSGFPLLSEGKNSRPVTAEPDVSEQATVPVSSPDTQKSKLITVPVRSGQRIYAPNSDLIVTANVSAGAELIADGNIHIYGLMRGRVLAGAAGDTECLIFCSHLHAELISIAGQYWLSDQIPAEFTGKAAKLSLVNNELTINNLI